MNLVKKLTYLVLVFAMVLTLAACGGDTADETTATDETTPVEEEASQEATEDATEQAAGQISSIGLGAVTALDKSTEIKEDKGQAQEDTTIVAAAFDADGKIVDVKIDVAQNKAGLNDDGTFKFALTDELKTKRDLGDEYGMKKASGIKKEWFEQADALEDAWTGKTVEEIVAMPKEENVYVDLESSVTIKVNGYEAALQNAWENKVDAAGAVKLGLGIESHFGSRSAEAADDKGASVQFETYMAAVALDGDNKIVANSINVAQNSVSYNADGTLAEGFNPEGTNKKALGADYVMVKASGIGKEWFEQIAALEQHLVGKTSEEVNAIPVEKRDDSHLAVPTDEELTSSVTITIDGYQKVVTEAIENAQ